MERMTRRGRVVALCVVAWLCCGDGAAPTAKAHSLRADPGLPANDLNDLLELTGVPTPEQAPLQDNPEPPLEPTPRAICEPGSHPLEGVQGRVPAAALDSPEAERGWTCNLEVVGHHRTTGGFRTWRYVDRQGHECAFHDTSRHRPQAPAQPLGGQRLRPMEIDGRRYLLEFDEFAFRFNALPPPHTVGAARIIDISDETRPRVVSNLPLDVNQPAQHAAAANDPSPLPLSSFTYSAHYCAVPREVDPQIAACSFINAGLRIFDIRDPLQPREVAYYIAPSGSNGNFAMSQPAFVPERREVWYTDATSGFWSLRLDAAVWPSKGPCPSPPGSLAGARLGPLRIGQTRTSAAVAAAASITTAWPAARSGSATSRRTSGARCPRPTAARPP